MTALSLSFAFLGCLVFAGYLIARRDAYRETVHEKLDDVTRRVRALEERRKAWDEAGSFVEAERAKRGFARG